MIEKNNVSTKYLSTLKEQVVKNKDSIQLNSKISAFLINERHINEAIPYLLKILELSCNDDTIKLKILEFLSNRKKENSSNNDAKKYYAVRQTTALGEHYKERVDNFNKAVYQNKILKKKDHPQTDNKEDKTILLTKRIGEKVVIQENIDLSIIDILDDKVRFKINLPKNITVLSNESYTEIVEFNKRAAKTNKNSLKLACLKLKL